LLQLFHFIAKKLQNERQWIYTILQGGCMLTTKLENLNQTIDDSLKAFLTYRSISINASNSFTELLSKIPKNDTRLPLFQYLAYMRSQFISFIETSTHSSVTDEAISEHLTFFFNVLKELSCTKESIKITFKIGNSQYTIPGLLTATTGSDSNTANIINTHILTPLNLSLINLKDKILVKNAIKIIALNFIHIQTIKAQEMKISELLSKLTLLEMGNKTSMTKLAEQTDVIETLEKKQGYLSCTLEEKKQNIDALHSVNEKLKRELSKQNEDSAKKNREVTETLQEKEQKLIALSQQNETLMHELAQTKSDLDKQKIFNRILHTKNKTLEKKALIPASKTSIPISSKADSPQKTANSPLLFNSFILGSVFSHTMFNPEDMSATEKKLSHS
jgi:hypothetical protein